MAQQTGTVTMTITDALRAVLGEHGAIAVAGAAGGIVRWLRLRESLRDGLTSVIIGGVCAVYLEPLALPALEPVLGKIIANPSKLSNLSAFLVGIGGIAVSGFVIDLWAARRRQIRGDGT
jgi:hypothetical protein